MTVVPVGNGDVIADCALRTGKSALRFGEGFDAGSKKWRKVPT